VAQPQGGRDGALIFVGDADGDVDLVDEVGRLGVGEDVAFEKLVGAPPSTAFTTLEVGEQVSGVSVSGVYVGSSRLALPGNGLYAALDALGSLSATRSSFAAGTALTAADEKRLTATRAALDPGSLIRYARVLP